VTRKRNRSVRHFIKRSPLAGPARALNRTWEGLASLFATTEERRHALSGPVGHRKVWRLKREYQIWFLKERGLQPHHYLLEIGCGTLRGGIPMIDLLLEGHYYGIEAREVALTEARKELEDAGLRGKTPALVLASDLSLVQLERRFDFVWAFSVLPHLDDDVLRGAFRCVGTHLSLDGEFLATAHVGARRQQGTWREFPALVRPIEFYAGEAAEQGLSVEDLGPLSTLGHPVDVVNSHHHMLLFRRS
jgi:hypothetical protein